MILAHALGGPVRVQWFLERWGVAALYVVGSVPLLLVLWLVLFPAEGLIRPRLVVAPDALAHGEWFTYRLSYCTDLARPARVSVSRELELVPVDGRGIIAVPPPTDFVIGGGDERVTCADREFLLPFPSIRPGQYVMRLNVGIDVNVFRSVAYVVESPVFTVMEE